MGLLEARRRHATRLRSEGPSPQAHAPLGATLGGLGARCVHYRSHGRALAALYRPPRPRPSGARTQAAPALLYLHGSWALRDEDLAACRPFIDAGFAVFAPSYRGENGNPGIHTMLWHELDDALAALAELRAQPEVDAERVFVFGHSAGGMLAALLAFHPGLDARLTGSVDGIYDLEVFDYQRPPFVDAPRERALRLALPHIEELEQPHIAFVGDRDLGLAATEEAGARARRSGAPLQAVVVPGDHLASVAPAMRLYLECAQRVL